MQREAQLDRIALAAWLPLVIAFFLLFFQVHWHRYIGRDATVIPALLWLGTPALWAAVVAWPYRQTSGSCRAALLLGVLLTLTPLIHIAVVLIARTGR